MKRAYFPILFKDGFFISEKIEEIVDQQEIYNILTSERMYDFTRVTEKNGVFKLCSHEISCGLCGETKPAYASIERDGPAFSVASQAEAFVTQVGSLFNKGSNSITLNTPLSKECTYTCTSCGEMLKKANIEDFIFGYLKIEKNDVIRLICAFENETNKFSKNISITKRRISVYDEEEAAFINCDDILYEILEFDIKRGEVTSYSYCNGITTEFSLERLLEKKTALTKGIDAVTIIRTQLLNAFKTFWSKDFEFPFHQAELDIRKLILITKFVGFPRSFYENLPINFESGNTEIDENFNKLEKSLHKYREVSTVYDKLGLPGDEKIKNLILSKPYFLFFSNEIKRLYPLLGKENMAHFLVYSKSAVILEFLYNYDGVFEYIEDFFQTVGSDLLFLALTIDIDMHLSYMLSYPILSNVCKMKQKKYWENKLDDWNADGFCSFNEGRRSVGKLDNFPHPMVCEIEREYIRGFWFIPIENCNDLLRLRKETGKETKCRNPLVGIMFHGEYVGDLELNHSRKSAVIGIHLKFGFTDNKNLDSAIQAFCHKNNIEKTEEGNDDEFRKSNTICTRCFF